MADVSLFDKIRIGIASSEDILGWSHGEVKKPETINYRTFKPERDGLFCERIFGPVKDWECACGRYKKIKYKGIVCERCGVEVTRSKVRRERMGHVELAAPVCHIWYLKGVPSPLSLILDISPRLLEKVIYFASFIIIDIDNEKIADILPDIRVAVEVEKANLQMQMRELEEESFKRFADDLNNNREEYDELFARERAKAVNDRIKAEYRDADDRLKDLDLAVEILGKLERNQLIDEDKYRAVSKLLDSVGSRLGKDLRSLVRANIGAEAIKELLHRVDLERLARELRQEIIMTTSQRRARAIKRLEVVEALVSSRSRPEWMILDVTPVISPELRPMVQLDGGRFATSDLNDLYRRIINRNNRLKKIIEIHAPESIINHEKRLLQEAVDALIDNGRRARPVVGSNSRPLKSLSDMLKGKEGRFRKNLLGKRVDYSGRSVIVVGPHLKLHQAGLPKEMALELFKPFVMKTLVEKKITQNIKTAKRMIDRMHPAVWDGLEEVIKEHPILLNRAPTLHRLGIQAFEPILVDGKAIQVHPLVCNMYNADFDGDQMAVHIPLSTQAQAEARVLMLSTQNLFSPADGRPTCAPVQDIILGNYALTFVRNEARENLAEIERLHAEDPEKNPPARTYANPEEVIMYLDTPIKEQRIATNDPIKVRIKRPIFRPDSEVDFRDPVTGAEYRKVTTQTEEGDEFQELQPYEQEFETFIATCTPGQLVLNTILPYPIKHSDEFLKVELNKKALSEMILTVHRRAGVGATIKLLDDMKDMGFKWATRYGLSVAITDMDPPARREEMIKDADDRSTKITNQFRRGMLTYNEMTQSLVKLWTDTYDEIGKAIVAGLHQMNPLSIVTVSGARGSVKQLAQLAGMRGLMFNQFNEVIYELPVKSSFHKGLSMLEYFVTTHGARKGLADTALRTADAGYLTRRLCDVAQDVIVKARDCGTTDGILAHRIVDQGEAIEPIADRLVGRVALSVIVDPDTGEALTEFQEPMTRDNAKRITAIENKFVAESAAAETEEEKNAIADKYRGYGFEADEHGYLSVMIRSPLTCELEQGICSKCYGTDLSTSKLVEVGLSVGIIAAQSIGEPGTQLTMRTFHTGGVAGSATIARTNQYKTGRFIRQFMEDFATATDTDMKAFDPTKLLESQESVVKSFFSNKDSVPLTIQPVEVDTADPKVKRKTERASKAAQKAADKLDSDSRKQWERARKTFFYSWSGESSGIVRVEEIFEARRQPRGKAIICPVTGVVRDIRESSFGRWVIVEATVKTTSTLKDAYIGDQQNWATNSNGEYEGGLQKAIGQKLTTATLALLRKAEVTSVNVYYPILVPPLGKLPVSKGTKVIKGDPLTEGPRDPHEVLELAGASAVYDYFVENLQSVYKSQGVDINDKHIEVIIRQMLRKRQIKEPGDTPYLPGQMVDRFAYQRANDQVRRLIQEGKKIKYVDPITGENIERDPKEATATWILLGITEASLATESFLSAASFQKTTRVLTEAAVRGKKDHLIGLKENVIIGRLIPSGTGVKQYRDIGIDVQRGPSWAEQSLTALVEADERGMEDALGALNFPSLADMAADEDDFEEEVK
ncbi:DNA-directed RNA polymerase subunit beta' [Fimbriimonas ginsengisoli]|uniref:DNA-directed RNA polymerase subunit beta' n=1 Tax=Fimbriimonas ginsengisoli Gsoil 348 TaxID=661478 RepID=A0A068NTG4_FIMGI|nr:DNA-directed RNA polymerase subunit beta' [Fimbriimonas ginsengisoli]AIE86843.1 DNA-directed RNA polymerase subunit beta' [Fimbriimonas ginsengisoli Gsoil 348]